MTCTACNIPQGAFEQNSAQFEQVPPNECSQSVSVWSAPIAHSHSTATRSPDVTLLCHSRWYVPTLVVFSRARVFVVMVAPSFLVAIFTFGGETQPPTNRDAFSVEGRQKHPKPPFIAAFAAPQPWIVEGGR